MSRQREFEQANQDLLALLQRAEAAHGSGTVPGPTLGTRQRRTRAAWRAGIVWGVAALVAIVGLGVASRNLRQVAETTGVRAQEATEGHVSLAGTYMGDRAGSGVVLWKVLADDQHVVTLVLAQGLVPPFTPRSGERLRVIGQAMGEGTLSVTRAEDLQRLPNLRPGFRRYGLFVVRNGIGTGDTFDHERLSFLASGWPEGTYHSVDLGVDERLVPLALFLGK